MISGVSGGDGPLKGFIAAYKAIKPVKKCGASGRFQSAVKKPPKRGKVPQWTTVGAATWLTGSYDPEQGSYWPTGNPFPDTDGALRKGDNLYSNCVLALDAKTGKLRWYFQFTPHDIHDWDATEPLVLADTVFKGKNRKLLMQANRSGFFYVLDRITGEFLLGAPFVKRLNWASGIGADGRPILTENNEPTRGRENVSCCPREPPTGTEPPSTRPPHCFM